MERYGLVVESGDIAAKRFASAGLIDPERGVYLNDHDGFPARVGADVARMNDDDIANRFLAEALVGNTDWTFKGAGVFSTLWNVEVFGIPSEDPQIPIPQDFDLSSVLKANRDAEKSYFPDGDACCAAFPAGKRDPNRIVTEDLSIAIPTGPERQRSRSSGSGSSPPCHSGDRRSLLEFGTVTTGCS